MLEHVAIAMTVGSLAHAQAPARVVLADADPELRRTVADSLRPWHIEVVDDDAVPSDPKARADETSARFVVWRDGDQLVVYDRTSDQAERRPSHAGTFDAVEAAAAALTVKTMMRLPPLVVTAPPPQPVVAEPDLEFRIEGGGGSRYEHGLDGNVALRFDIAAQVRPFGDGWRFGVLGDFGASAEVDQAGFKGTWSNFAALALASWSVQRDWDFGPWLAIGVEHSSLDGTEMKTARTETATLLAVRGGGAVHRGVGIFSVGAIRAVRTATVARKRAARTASAATPRTARRTAMPARTTASVAAASASSARTASARARNRRRARPYAAPASTAPCAARVAIAAAGCARRTRRPA